jgi:hypothetical protein
MRLQRLTHLPDWGSLAAAAALFISPWALHYTNPMATLATCFSASILVILSTMAIAEVDDSEEPEYLILGAWLLISPWVLGFWTDASALIVHMVFGVGMIVHSAWEMWGAPSSQRTRNQ